MNSENKIQLEEDTHPFKESMIKLKKWFITNIFLIILLVIILMVGFVSAFMEIDGSAWGKVHDAESFFKFIGDSFTGNIETPKELTEAEKLAMQSALFTKRLMAIARTAASAFIMIFAMGQGDMQGHTTPKYREAQELLHKTPKCPRVYRAKSPAGKRLEIIRKKILPYTITILAAFIVFPDFKWNFHSSQFMMTLTILLVACAGGISSYYSMYTYYRDGDYLVAIKERIKKMEIRDAKRAEKKKLKEMKKKMKKEAKDGKSI